MQFESSNIIIAFYFNGTLRKIGKPSSKRADSIIMPPSDQLYIYLILLYRHNLTFLHILYNTILYSIHQCNLKTVLQKLAIIKGQSNKIFNSQFFLSFAPAWATDQWVK